MDAYTRPVSVTAAAPAPFAEGAFRLLRGQRLLARAGRVLASSSEVSETLGAVARLLLEDFADGCAVDMVRPQARLERVVLATRDPAREAMVRELERRYPAGRGSAAANVIAARTGQTQLYGEVPDELLAAASVDADHLTLWRRLSLTSVACVPLNARGRTLAVMTVASTAPDRHFDAVDVEILEELAQRAALAIDNARLLASAQEELRQRREAEAGRDRTDALLRMLVEGGRVLNRSLDPEQTLSDLTRLVITSVADAAVTWVVGADGMIRGTNAAHADPAAQALLRIFEPGTSLIEPTHVAATVIRSGEPLFIEAAARSDLDALGVPNSAALLPLLPLTGILVPLRARGRILGALGVGATPGGCAPLQAGDVPYFEQLAAVAGLALENARLYEAERQARDAAEEASRAKSQFLAMMSHELRTPLTGIIGYADLLTNGAWGALNPTQALKVERIRAGAWHLVSVIDEILTFARTEVGRERARLAATDLAVVARESVQLVAPQAAEKGLGLVLDLPDGPVLLDTDAPKVRQILLNLLGNAVKFTELGDITVRLEVRAGRVCISVRDTGPGIPADQRARIFEPFTQVDGSNTRVKGGTGLGLTVSRRLAQLLGGDITLRSEPGSGAEFTLQLPAGAGSGV